jgi:transposase
MFSIPKATQTTFIYSPTIYEKLISEDTILYRINQKIDFSFVNEACSDLYSPDMGRPVKNTPEMMFRSAIVQYLNDFSDREMEYSARFDIMTKWFIGIPIEDRSFDHSALGDFRDRLGEERWKKLFFLILNQIEDAGFAKGKQYVDATHVIANIAIPSTINLIRQGIKSVMNEIEKIDPELYEELGGEKTAKKKEKDYKFSTEEKKIKLVEAVEEARKLNAKAEGLSPSVDEKVNLLKRILNENIEENDGQVQKRKDKVEDRIVSTVDEDARHGAKSDKKKFIGYKTNSMMSDDGFVTNITTSAGNGYDGDVLVPLVDEKTENSSKTVEIIGDTHYGSADNRYEMSTRGITIVAPFREDFNPTGLFTQEKFNIENDAVTCPAGCRTMISHYDEKSGSTTFFFKKEVCQDCSLKEQCTKQDRRTITIGKHYELVKEAKEYNKTKEYNEDMKGRAKIEPKQAEMKRFHGLKRAKYWGLPKVNIQSIITGIVVNVKRFVNVLESASSLKM